MWRKVSDRRKVTPHTIDELYENIAFLQGMSASNYALIVCLAKYLPTEQRGLILAEAREFLAKQGRPESWFGSEAEGREFDGGRAMIMSDFAHSVDPTGSNDR